MPQTLDLKKREEQSGYLEEKGKSKQSCGTVLLVDILDAKSQANSGLQKTLLFSIRLHCLQLR